MLRLSTTSLVSFFREQAPYLSVAAIVAAIFWAVGLSVNPATVVLYALCLGNLINFATIRTHRVYRGRPFPYNILIFLAALVVLTPPVYVISSVVVWWISQPTPQ
jgi:hypothetical protein